MSLPGVCLVIPERYGDARGWFQETFNARKFHEAGLPDRFAQDNQSRSAAGVLRGLHYQLNEPQGKLVRVLAGRIWDVAVDLRRDSPHRGQWTATYLQPENAQGETEMLWIPEGFAHGFLVLSPHAEVLYKTTRGYVPNDERTIRWDDPQLAIAWPLAELGATRLTVSARDAAAPSFANAQLP